LDGDESGSLGEDDQEDWGFVEEWRVVENMIVATQEFLSKWLVPSVIAATMVVILYRVGTSARNR
jgi:hypothetical protein